MHDASKYRQIKVVITLGARHHFVDVLAVVKQRGVAEQTRQIHTIKLTAEQTDTVADLLTATALALLETADRL